jgi:hypothetical protein
MLFIELDVGLIDGFARQADEPKIGKAIPSTQSFAKAAEERRAD